MNLDSLSIGVTRRLALALMLLIAVPASAQGPLGDCTIGAGRGATLLYPYFETDLNSFNGPATLLSFNNGFGSPTLVRVVLWTDWGFPTLAFDVYMPARSMSSLNLRDTMNGGIPSTGEGFDLSGFEGCDENPPFHSNPALTSDQIAQLRADHTGQRGPIFATCIGSATSDGIARGYVTIDVVDECSGIEAGTVTVSPEDSAYFADGDSSGVAINENRLWGDIFYLSNDTASAQGSPAISLWADAELFSGDDIFTFYGRFSDWDGRDNRVPLPAVWDARFISGGPFAGDANLIIYNDSGQRPEAVPCGEQPAGFPLQGSINAYNSEGQDRQTLDDEFPLIAGLMSQRGSIADLSIPYAFGHLDIFSRPQGMQTWIQPTLSAAGLYSASLDASPFRTSCSFTPPTSIRPDPAESTKRSLRPRDRR